MSKWAIRDIEHGKTYFFDSYEEMVRWVIQKEIQIQSKLVDEICQKHGAH